MSQKNEFEIGDLIIYAPHYSGLGAWIMKGDIGIVIDIRYTPFPDKYQIVTVKWANGTMGEVEMASQVLEKIPLDKPFKT